MEETKTTQLILQSQETLTEKQRYEELERQYQKFLECDEQQSQLVQSSSAEKAIKKRGMGAPQYGGSDFVIDHKTKKCGYKTNGG